MGVSVTVGFPRVLENPVNFLKAETIKILQWKRIQMLVNLPMEVGDLFVLLCFVLFNC